MTHDTDPSDRQSEGAEELVGARAAQGASGDEGQAAADTDRGRQARWRPSSKLVFCVGLGAVAVALVFLLFSLPLVPSLVLCAVIGLVIDFFARFVHRGIRRWHELRILSRALEGVRRVERERGVDKPTLDQLKDHFERCGLSSEWNEFNESLHEVTADTDGPSASAAKRWYQTEPSEFFLTRGAIVDRPLAVDYFKHLPGILTGIGIIGTFAGLIGGLQGFEFASDTTTVRSSVDDLVRAVKEAFWVSASAIVAAMGVTFVEKQTLEALYRRIHIIQGRVNTLFHGIPAEKYLATIELKSDESASELKNLRQGLIEGFEEIIDGLKDTIERASAATAAEIGQQLAEPVATLRDAIERTLSQQESAVHDLLASTLQEFAARLEEAVGRHLTEAAGQLSGAIVQLQRVLEQAPREIEAVVGEVRSTLSEIARAAEPMREHTDRMATAAERLTTAVETSASTWDYASQRFRATTVALDEVTDRLEPVAQQVSSAAGGLEAAAAAVSSATTSLGETADRIQHLRSVVGELSETLKREADQRSELGALVGSAADRLSAAQGAVESFLKDLDQALTGQLRAFADAIRTTTDRTHEQFSARLSDAVGILGGGVEDLRGAVDEIHTAVGEMRSFVDGSLHPTLSEIGRRLEPPVGEAESGVI